MSDAHPVDLTAHHLSLHTAYPAEEWRPVARRWWAAGADLADLERWATTASRLTPELAAAALPLMQVAPEAAAGTVADAFDELEGATRTLGRTIRDELLAPLIEPILDRLVRLITRGGRP